MRGEFVDIDGARLYYYAAGQRGAGEPILLIHGFPTSSHIWRELAPVLPAGHRVIIVDLLGYGRSDRPHGRPVGLRAHADRLLALLDVLRIDYVTIIGHDIGGGIAQIMTLRSPARIARLCLVNSVPLDGWPSREVRMARAMFPLTRYLPDSWLLSFLRTDLTRGYADAESGAHSVEQYIRPFASVEGRNAFMEHLNALDPRDTLALAPRTREIMAPTAILCGAQDPFLSLAASQRLHAAIPSSTLDVIPGAKHAIPEESPERLRAIVDALMERSE